MPDDDGARRRTLHASPSRKACITCSRSPAASIRWCSARRKFSASSRTPTSSRITHGHTGARLNKAFQRAFNVAKHIRTETNIQRGSVSVASVAVELAEKIFSSLDEHEVLVIGAGETSEKTARALLSRGAQQHHRRQPLARTRAWRWPTNWADAPCSLTIGRRNLSKIDIAISSTSAPHHILDRAKLEPLMKPRKHRPLLLIDIAVPRDIDPEVNFLENVYLYNIDDLQAIADDYLKLRKEEIARCEAHHRRKSQAAA